MEFESISQRSTGVHPSPVDLQGIFVVTIGIEPTYSCSSGTRLNTSQLSYHGEELNIIFYQGGLYYIFVLHINNKVKIFKTSVSYFVFKPF
jgi:hypothetical protein